MSISKFLDDQSYLCFITLRLLVTNGSNVEDILWAISDEPGETEGNSHLLLGPCVLAQTLNRGLHMQIAR